MSPAKTQLKRLADRLSEEDASLALSLVRTLARQRRTLERKLEDQQDVADVRAAREEATAKGTIPWDQVKAKHGL